MNHHTDNCRYCVAHQRFNCSKVNTKTKFGAYVRLHTIEFGQRVSQLKNQTSKVDWNFDMIIMIVPKIAWHSTPASWIFPLSDISWNLLVTVSFCCFVFPRIGPKNQSVILTFSVMTFSADFANLTDLAEFKLGKNWLILCIVDQIRQKSMKFSTSNCKQDSLMGELAPYIWPIRYFCQIAEISPPPWGMSLVRKKGWGSGVSS